MPHLHDDKNSSDNDDASRGSECSKTDTGSGPVAPSKTEDALSLDKAAEDSATCKLLSLAALAEEHGKAHGETQEKNAKMAVHSEQTKEDPPSSPAPGKSQPPSEEEQPQLPPLAPSVHQRWGMMSHPPRYHPPPHAFFRHGGPMRPMYPLPGMGGPPPRGTASPGAIDHLRRGYPPIWTASGAVPPRPPYHPHNMRGGTPSPLPSAFRGSPYTTHQSPSNDDDNSVASTSKRPAAKRVSLGNAPKSILKKQRLEASSSQDSEAAASTDDADTQISKKGSDDTSDEATKPDAGMKGSGRSTIDSVVVKKDTLSSEHAASKKQRIISPASSNESPRTDQDDGYTYTTEGSLSPQHHYPGYSEMPTVSPNHPYHPHYHHGETPFPMRGPHHPAMHGVMYPGAHHRGDGRSYMPPSPLYLHHRHPFPPGIVPGGMYPPHDRNMSARGRAPFGGMPAFFAARGRMDPASPPNAETSDADEEEHLLEKSRQRGATCTSPVLSGGPKTLNSLSTVRSLMHAAETLSDIPGSANRCIPLKPPIPSKYWG